MSRATPESTSAPATATHRVLRIALLALAATAALAAFPSISSAAENRSDVVPAGLTAWLPTAHFVLYYNPATPSPVTGISLPQYVSAGSADFEEAYGHDVSGGGLMPNASLKAPIPDSDGKTDVYLTAPKTDPGYRGGITYLDPSPSQSAFITMSPDMSRTAFRMRAAHEFMHVLENAYVRPLRIAFGPMSEAFAGWGAAWALADVNPLDNNFYGEQYNAAHPWMSLDCDTAQCGSGYWQWMFVQDQVQNYGPGFVDLYYQLYTAGGNGSNWASGGYWLDQATRAVSAGTQTLSTRFAAYAIDVWDPTRWSKNSIRILLDENGLQPAAYTYAAGSTSDTGWKSVAIDHLAARYVRVFNSASNAAPARAQLEVSWQRPDGMAAPVIPLVKYPGRANWSYAASVGGTQGTLRVSIDPTQVTDVVLPLVNDSMSADGLQFSFRIQIHTAPANDDAPRVSGVPSVGTRLTASTGRWSGTAPISYAYQWQRCLRTCSNIPGANRSAYTPGAADIGAMVRVVVKASNALGGTDEVSEQVGPVAPSSAQIKAALTKVLSPTGGGARIATLLKRGGYTFTFGAPSEGAVIVYWNQIVRRRPMLLGSGRAGFSGARRGKLTVRLTPKGKQVLRAARRVTITVKASFTPAGNRATTITKTLTLKR